jgi:hypothetical protein
MAVPGAYSQPAAEIAFWVTAGAWSIGERILTFRDFRSGAWKARQDAGDMGGITGAFTVPS